jgi:protein-arginine kinase activator protein McsA
MRTKICALCKTEELTLFRVQIVKGKTWIFVCETCCNRVKVQENYRYGGTWKG